ncbi:zonular occludens toxin domain-containing protein [Nitrosomonas sp.]|uniref:zonular occludens toxin domain-containing protein n=1 Tax=Nitrosomonas sp. TaxID=42353 RepID=UPI001E094E20|nr:zonular occludens toxin domain-containing protein [Nitrosomonas sp.]MBX3617492.1 zonular occludens toxin [Nitrosomonas sp.]
MITLLTAVPRTGKTSYAVWDYIKPALDSNRPVYVIGIPKLSLPHIKIDKEFLYSWHERAYDPDIEEDKLLNIPKGALIVVDEAWQVWPAGGIAKAPESVQHLAMHGHYGIDFLLITQKPHLMHTAVLAQVSCHKHILQKWSGHWLLEWPEYCQNPTAKSNRNDAIKIPFKPRTQAWPLYHSGQFHAKLKQQKPFSLYVSIALFLFLPFFVYGFYNNFNSKYLSDEPTIEANSNDSDSSDYLDKLSNKLPSVSTIQVVKESSALQTLVKFDSVVPSDYDWSEVSACMQSKANGCICYGYSAQRLVVPLEICEAAIKHGWPSSKSSTPKRYSLPESS